ncbi:Ran-specific GTPase-activating protein 2 [Pseudozyma hubeiensis]|nr:Ran-specific GTPase-activating protein 2 [Pseudozyma hubeiensis]
MSETKAELAQTPKPDDDQPREARPPSSPQQQSSSPQSSPAASTSRAVAAKEPVQHSEDTTSRRKREREGSLEPSQLTPSRATEAIPAKKNRFEDSLQEEDDDDTASHVAETEKVGQIRKKVDELSTKELELKSAESAAKPASATSSVTTNEKVASEEAVPKASALSESAREPKAAEAQPTKPLQDPPARTQPTFSSFSSKSSPFSSVPTSSGSSSASASKGGFSAFSAKSSSPLVGAGIQPSNLGSSIGGHHEGNGSASPLSSAPSKPIAKGSSFGFGAFAGASPLAKPKADSPAAASEKDSGKSQPTDDKASFTQKLLSHDMDASAASDSKTKPLLEASEAESKTGEEDEESIHSIRAKLYTMAEDQSWKERGTGTLRVNIPKTSSEKRPARLVMRADGILRVILNVPLFKGMKCELHEKFVRIVALEDNKPVHYAIKLSNPNNAAALMDVLDEFVVSDDSISHA